MRHVILPLPRDHPNSHIGAPADNMVSRAKFQYPCLLAQLYSNPRPP